MWSREAVTYWSTLISKWIRIKWILKINPFDKRYDSTFQIVNFTFISSNIPSELIYGVYIAQLIRFSTNCTQYSDFEDRAPLIRQQLLLGWRQCHTISMDVIRNWLTSTIYPFLKWKRKVSFRLDFLFLITCNTFTRHWKTRNVLCKNQEMLNLRERLVHPEFLMGSVFLICLCPLNKESGVY